MARREDLIRIGAFELDEGAAELRLQGRTVVVEPLVLRLIACLARRAPNVVSKEELIDELWGGRAVSDSALSRAVSLARAALKAGFDENPILSVYGTGYRLSAEATEPGEPAPYEAAAEQAASRATGDPSTTGVARVRDGARPMIVTHTPLFVGRKRELSRLTDALAGAQKGEGSLQLVSGEAGIGKTRLSEQLAELAIEQGMAARVGRCAESEGAPSFWPWVQIIRAELEAAGRGALEELGEAPARRIERMLSTDTEPEMRTDPDRQYSANERFALFDAVSRFLVNAADRSPMLVVIDDLHRADRSSLALMHFLVREIGTSSLSLVGTYRELDLQQRPHERATVAEIARAGRAQHHALGGLEEGDIGAFLPDRDVSRELAHLLHAKTGGNPLFLTHLAALLASAELEGGGLAGLEARLPPALRDAIGLQLDGLSEACRSLLQIASILGRDFELEVLCQLAARAPNEALELVEEAVAAGVLVDLGSDIPGYRFCHVLVRDHLYDALASGDRADHHLRAARTLEARREGAHPSHLATIAHHFRSAQPIGPVEPAIDYSMRAGSLAQERAAYEEGAWQYERALGLIDALTGESRDLSLRRCDILLELSGARARAGDPDGARESCREAVALARELELPDVLARAAFALSPGFFSIETALYDDELVALLEEALEANEAGSTDTRIRLQSRLATALYWSDQAERRERLSTSALSVAEENGESAALAWALNARHSALWGPDNLALRVELSTRAVRLAERVSSEEDTLLHRAVMITDLAERGSMHSVDEGIQRFQKSAARLAQPQSMWLAPMWQAMRSLSEGEFGRAETLASRAIEIGRRVKSEDAENCWAAQTCLARFETGHGDSILRVLRAHVREHPRLLAFRAAPGWVSAELGFVEEAEHDLGQFSDERFSNIPRDMNWLGMMTMLAMTCAELRNHVVSQQLLELLSPYADRYALLGYGAIFLGSVAAQLARLEAIVHGSHAAEPLFAKGRHLNLRVRALPWIARSEYDQAVGHLSDAEYRSARGLLESCTRRADSLGMTHLHSRATAKASAIQEF